MNEAIEKTLKAGEILKKVVEEAKEKIKPGIKILEVAEFIERRTEELGAKPAFPCNLSINSDAAHFTPKANDNRVFKEGDLVKLDYGVHLDGYIADMAISVDLGDHSDLIKAAREAVEAAVEIVKAGTSTSKLGEVIESTIKSYGYRPIVNLTGHGLQPYSVHSPPSIPNYASQKGFELEEGMIIAIEPFATNGVGRVVERKECEIYSLTSIRSIRMKQAKELMDEISKKYRSLPFARRWIKVSEIIFSKLIKEGVLRSYPVLYEVSNGKVSQWEHTVIVEKDGALLVTR
ncbi:MAG: type II methionyl aminopeptidase [Archaeoglobaceae archaeon]|nr:type II methionyl aminopeptidase [Archaeoglobaceae archaeon]MCX8152577.1 type II methionyl aminopeptidase [Archaeoglobaceae archaeon]MDW8014141.1 type II methionyl aminopeptidase [Archaeoglobaceae archaeon]